MGTEEDIIELALPTLHYILGKRLKFSRAWKNVEVETKKKVFRIKWFDPKNKDQEGLDTFCTRERPMSLRSMETEIDDQMIKYLKEKGLIKSEDVSR
jgi:hypothetical protein